MAKWGLRVGAPTIQSLTQSQVFTDGVNVATNRLLCPVGTVVLEGRLWQLGKEDRLKFPPLCFPIPFPLVHGPPALTTRKGMKCSFPNPYPTPQRLSSTNSRNCQTGSFAKAFDKVSGTN